ncbi:MAG: PilZ domain-containing protein [Thermodesulfobacteriota bacterium]|nr:PilZ domain-containing protein [Thermodesulfobacteriota bacterium]
MNQNQRSVKREPCDGKSSVEFKPAKSQISYQFKLRDFSSGGMGILVGKNSQSLNFLNVGDVLDMKYYSNEIAAEASFLKTKISHISAPEQVRHQNHVVIGLQILD